jgi:glycosyltransferase involved in cell wall biosynthesis
MIKKLAENNHRVWIITNKIEEENYPDHKNIHMIFVPPILKYQGGLPSSIKDNIRYLINALKIGKKIIKENDIDLIHSNNFTPALTGGFLSLLTSKKHITSVWDVFTLCGCDYWKKWVSQTKISKINKFIGPIFEKLVLKTRCDAFHTISDASKEDLIKFGAKKPIYNIPPTIEEIQESHMIQNNNQFIYVGRLVFYKNVEILVKAINIVKNQENKIKLVIVGGGPQLEMIQEMVRNMNLEENITIKGYVTSEEKIKIISQSNAMLFPSKCEGFGLVILESWQQNRPVIASDIPPMSDIIQHEKTGLIVDPNDEKKWAEKIIQLIKNPSISDEMGKKGNKVLHEKYNQEIFYQKLISMYQSVL